MSDEKKMISLSIGRGRGISFRAAAPQTAPPTRDPVPERKTSDPGDSTEGTSSGSIIRTKPSCIDSKTGTSGTGVIMSGNYFRLKMNPDFMFTRYRVDFQPVTEDERLRKSLIGRCKTHLGGYLYDGGSMIFLSRRLKDYEEFALPTKEGMEISVCLKYTGEVKFSDNVATQFLNLVLRRTMQGLKMQLVGRNLYDPAAKVRNFELCKS